ncbi:PfkB family carbohydrate kinase [Roseomonas sp. NAR14]|uniref:Bifunctional protein HldE n=1 Tax=Roseomonas acroporae TaxID=2937791 RepID=A0A9X1YB18_9PROT|nr:PfkB family carbohydrate kinase [Roseomonas acroporae]MCK8786816.1 PfkB family carbohydrate kinase [Roseomonas acroporae]
MLADAVRQLRRASVLVVGDAMLDRYLYGTVNRVSPEAPVPILSVERELAMPGGAGNVVRNLTALGAAVAFISVVGDDQAGSDLTGLIGGTHNVEPWLLVQGGRPTTTKSRFLASGQQLLRADQEVAMPIHPRLAERLVKIAADAVAATSVMVLSDYRKGVLAGDVAPRLVAAGKAAGRRVVVDHKGADFAPYAGADLVTPNRAELRAATGLPVGTAEEVAAAARRLRDAHGFGAVLVTRGEHGVTLLEGTGEAESVRHFPAVAQDVFDVSGAGDTITAIAAAGLAVGLPLALAAQLANVAAGIVVGKIGTATVRESEILQALKPENSVLRKVVTRALAVDQVDRWRRRNLRVGFTDGSFDPLQPGHRHLLEQARAWCDRLVVGLRSDDGVRRLKGAGRPAQTAVLRAATLASLGVVDLVTVFEEDTPLELIRLLRPEVLVRGPTQAGGRAGGQGSGLGSGLGAPAVPGAELLAEWGGQLRLAEPLSGDDPAQVARPVGAL